MKARNLITVILNMFLIVKYNKCDACLLKMILVQNLVKKFTNIHSYYYTRYNISQSNINIINIANYHAFISNFKIQEYIKCAEYCKVL